MLGRIKFSKVFRERPHWHVFVFHYGMGIVVAWQLVEDLAFGQWKVYAGIYAPWRQWVDWTSVLGRNPYPYFVAAEALLLVLFFLRFRTGPVAALLALVIFLDNLGSFTNHRLLIAIVVLLYSLRPLAKRDPGKGFRGKQVYWSLDLVRWQIAIVYITTVAHKLNESFLSGRALQNTIWMLQHQGMHHYPEWMFRALLAPGICLFLAWFTIVAELGVAIGAQFRRLAKWFLLAGLVLHLGIALLMPYLWTFTLLIIVCFIAFLPDRVQEDGPYVLRHRPGMGPAKWMLLLWPGYVVQEEAADLPSSWDLELPDGRSVAGYRAWVELLSLSPFFSLVAEIMRIPLGEKPRG